MSKKILTQIIMQTWWHFEDYYSENPFQKRRYVQDIYLYKDQVDDADFENTLRVILPKNIFNIHARMRNPNKELAYVVATAPRSENESDEDIVMYIHLPNLDELPVVEIERKNKVIQCLHLKLEIEYSQNKYKSNLGKKDFEEGGSIAHFNLLMFMKKTLPRKCYLKRFQLTIDIIISRLIHKWDNVLSIDYDKTYPEFSLTLPKGWMLRKNDKDGQISVYANCGDSTPTPLDVLAPAEEFIDGKRHYVSILSDMGNETYNRVLAETSSPLKLKIIYRTQLSPSIFTIFYVIPVIFMAASGLIVFFFPQIPEFGKFPTIVSIFIAYVVYIYTYLSYRKEGYNITNWFVIIFSVITLICILLSTFRCLI